MTYQLSPSSIGLLEECPLCFWLQFRKGLKRPDSIFPSLPSGMDRVLKEHFDSYIDKSELPPELKKHKIDAKLFQNRQLLEKWRSNKHGISWEDEKGNRLRGAVDNILVRGEKLIVLDYKTRGYSVKEDTHEHYRLQMDFYNFLLRKNNYSTEDYSYLLFYHPDKVIDNVLVFNTELVKIKVDVANAEKTFFNAISILDGPMPTFNKECSFCKYREAKVNSNLLDY